MTGLNLERFLWLLRADFGAWATLALIALVLALMTWTSWGSRRVLRKCLVLSVVAHVALVIYGGSLPLVLLVRGTFERSEPARERIRQIRVLPLTSGPGAANTLARSGGPGLRVDAWDKPRDALALVETKVAAARPERPAVEVEPRPVEAPAAVVPPLEAAEPAVPEAPPAAAETVALAPPADRAAPVAPGEIAEPVMSRPSDPDAGASPLERLPASRPRDRIAPPDLGSGAGRMRPGDLELTAPATAPSLEAPVPLPPRNSPAPADPVVADAAAGSRAMRRSEAAEATASGVSAPVPIRRPQESPSTELRATDVRRVLRPTRGAEPVARRLSDSLGPLALSRATPSGLPQLPEIQGTIGGRPLTDVPEVYRSRLDPNRSAHAQRAGATPASEQAVERALAWLARHQDADGRWDAGIARFADGTPRQGDDDYTVHCPPGEPCTGECIYWEADTALTGLALLAFLGSGYTHTDGKYTEAVGRGLEFLRRAQKPDGDLRGDSKAVGMYCHAMATLALCEAYALTGDVRFRDPVQRAVNFIGRGRARDGLSWRYLPGADRGDTSILGWVVMALKSAKVAGIVVPPALQGGTLSWLGKVSSGSAHGLASYQPGQPPTPTMTAEAWVCRQFLGVGGPGATSREAASHLLEHGPGIDPYNLYYWYYGTLAMYQHGGEPWTQWNGQVRDQIVRRQRTEGHRAGSWDPDDSDYGAKGGRIYCTALATLTLEVYYRFLRLYDEPESVPAPPVGRFTRSPARDPS